MRYDKSIKWLKDLNYRLPGTVLRSKSYRRSTSKRFASKPWGLSRHDFFRPHRPRPDTYIDKYIDKYMVPGSKNNESNVEGSYCRDKVAGVTVCNHYYYTINTAIIADSTRGTSARSLRGE